MNSIEFILLGQPISWTRPAHGSYTGKHYDIQRSLKDYIRGKLTQSLPDLEPLIGPVHLEIKFYFQPKGIPLKNKHIYHAKKPDADNCAKFYMDTFNTYLYKDDASISKLTVSKFYCYDNNPRTEFKLSILNNKREDNGKDIEKEKENSTTYIK